MIVIREHLRKFLNLSRLFLCGISLLSKDGEIPLSTSLIFTSSQHLFQFLKIKMYDFKIVIHHWSSGVL